MLLAQQDASASGPAPADMRPLLFMFALLAVVYVFMVMRPQRAEAKKRKGMLDEVVKGDKVVTIGGIHAKVEAVDLDKGIITIEVAPKLTMRINKSALSSVTPKGKGGKAKKDGDDGAESKKGAERKKGSKGK